MLVLRNVAQKNGDISAFSIIRIQRDLAIKVKRLRSPKNLKKKIYILKRRSTGILPLRFLVNCEGKTGLFRLQHMSQDLKDTVLDEELENKILKFTKSLDGWMPKEIKGLQVDYYQYLTYKIENGKVSEVLP